MMKPDEFAAVIEQIVSCMQTEAAITALQQAFNNATAPGDCAVAINGDANHATIATGNGNIVLNITFQSDGVQN